MHQFLLYRALPTGGAACTNPCAQLAVCILHNTRTCTCTNRQCYIGSMLHTRVSAGSLAVSLLQEALTRSDVPETGWQHPCTPEALASSTVRVCVLVRCSVHQDGSTSVMRMRPEM